MVILENLESEGVGTVGFGDIDAVVELEETGVVNRPPARGGRLGGLKAFYSLGIRPELGADVGMKGRDVDDMGCAEGNVLKDGRSEGSPELLGGEDGSEVLRINLGVGPIPLFSVDVPSSS